MTINTKITKVQFRHFKAFEDFSVSLQEMNILVGPNNSGKSTILGAFQVLAAGIRRANAKTAERVLSPSGNAWGYFVSKEDLPISFENVHTNYDKSQHPIITFTLSNSNSLTLFFHADEGCVLIPHGIGAVRNPSSFRKQFPITL